MFWGNRKPLHAQNAVQGRKYARRSDNTFVEAAAAALNLWFFHPDYTVGTGIAPVQPIGCGMQRRARGLSPPVENFTPPRNFLILNFIQNIISMNTAFAHFLLLFEQCLFVHKLRAL